MVSVRDITARDVANDDPATVNVGQPLSKSRTVMEENTMRAVPVVDGAQFDGVLSYRDVMEKLHMDPSKTKVDPLVHTPPTVDDGQNLVDLARLRIDSGRKLFVQVDDDGRLTGTVSEEDIAYGARDAEELDGITVDDIMTSELVTVQADASFDTARKKMREHSISRLVVMDEGELAGVISTLDTLRTMVERQQMTQGEVRGEKGSLSDVPVSELMQRTDEIDAELVDAGTGVREALDIIAGTDALEVVVVDGGPAGIVTVKDVVDVVASHEAVESLLVQLTGPEVPAEKQAIHDKIETRLRGGLGRVLDRPEELTVHMKKYEKDGTQHKYTLNFRLTGELGTIRVNTHGWELLDAVDDGLEKLDRLVKQEKEKRRDQSRERRRDAKYSQS
ncbi:MAG: CBS domain-containing protein [Candidatus Nanohaloarchaea archaeon]|nr:CBS domain-containing protein [Candidatus Nanohaloarchaea archaeon]